MSGLGDRVPPYRAEWRTGDMRVWLLIGQDDNRDALVERVGEWRRTYPDHFTRIVTQHVVEFEMPGGS